MSWVGSSWLPDLEEIVSGGQTGVDRAGLDVAIELGLKHGGWCPKGRGAEDGVIPPRYELRECDSPIPDVRTELNVRDSDATLILYQDELAGGTKLTYQLACRYEKPCLLVDLKEPISTEQVRAWLRDHKVARLNVAGPRESRHPGITKLARDYLRRVLSGK